MNRLRRRDVVSREHAERLLRPYYPDFVACVQHGVNQVSEIPARIRAELGSRTMSSALNDFVVRHAERQFTDDREIRTDDSFDGFFFVIQQEIALRFKKVVGRNRVPCNFPTKRQLEIRWQQAEFDGFPNLTVVDLGYELNSVWTEVKSVTLSCRRGRHLEWIIPIAGDLQAYLFDEQGNATSSRKAIVRAKTAGKAQQNA